MTGKAQDVEIVRLFATNLRSRRLHMGISQEVLAEKAGVDRTYVSSCERGLRNVTISSLAQFGHALGIAPFELLKRVDRDG